MAICTEIFTPFLVTVKNLNDHRERNIKNRRKRRNFDSRSFGMKIA